MGLGMCSESEGPITAKLKSINMSLTKTLKTCNIRMPYNLKTMGSITSKLKNRKQWNEGEVQNLKYKSSQSSTSLL